jgi:hypothetical protein
MSRIDKAFCSSSWESIFDKPILQALSSSTSNHCPLLIIPHSAPPFWPKFRFEEFWAAILDFKDTVLQSWSKDTPTILNHMMTLHVKLGRVAKDLRAWSRGLIPHLKLFMAVCREVILQLETAQEQRNLLPSEIDFIQKLKTRLLELAAVEKIGQDKSPESPGSGKVMSTQSSFISWPILGSRRIISLPCK